MNFILGNTSINETSRIIFITELDYLCYLCPEPTCFPKAGTQNIKVDDNDLMETAKEAARAQFCMFCTS